MPSGSPEWRAHVLLPYINADWNRPRTQQGLDDILAKEQKHLLRAPEDEHAYPGWTEDRRRNHQLEAENRGLQNQVDKLQAEKEELQSKLQRREIKRQSTTNQSAPFKTVGDLLRERKEQLAARNKPLSSCSASGSHAQPLPVIFHNDYAEVTRMIDSYRLPTFPPARTDTQPPHTRRPLPQVSGPLTTSPSRSSHFQRTRMDGSVRPFLASRPTNTSLVNASARMEAAAGFRRFIESDATSKSTLHRDDQRQMYLTASQHMLIDRVDGVDIQHPQPTRASDDQDVSTEDTDRDDDSFVSCWSQ